MHGTWTSSNSPCPVNVSYLICRVLETQSERRLHTHGIQTLHMAHFPGDQDRSFYMRGVGDERDVIVNYESWSEREWQQLEIKRQTFCGLTAELLDLRRGQSNFQSNNFGTLCHFRRSWATVARGFRFRIPLGREHAYFCPSIPLPGSTLLQLDLSWPEGSCHPSVGLILMQLVDFFYLLFRFLPWT